MKKLYHLFLARSILFSPHSPFFKKIYETRLKIVRFNGIIVEVYYLNSKEDTEMGKNRQDVPMNLKWKLEDIFESLEAWEST